CEQYTDPVSGGFRPNRCVVAWCFDCICDPDVTKPWCTCTKDFTGEYCEIAITTANPITVPTTTPVALGRCGPYNGYANMCVLKDAGATCSPKSSDPFCTCSPAWTGTF
ncbi:hypothetical protein PMAYCL1PPCAC_00978, partial [Pristionchus mayeri]